MWIVIAIKLNICDIFWIFDINSYVCFWCFDLDNFMPF